MQLYYSVPSNKAEIIYYYSDKQIVIGYNMRYNLIVRVWRLDFNYGI